MNADTAPVLAALASIREGLDALVPTFEKIDETSARIDALAKDAGLGAVAHSPQLAPAVRACIDTLAKMHLMLTPPANSRAAEMSGFRPVAKGHEGGNAAPSTPTDVAAYVAAMDPEARAALFAKLATGEKP